MAVNQTQQEKNLAQLARIKRKYFSNSSAAADWWDKLTPQWRGVVLHAAGVNSGSDVFKAALSRCSWRKKFGGMEVPEVKRLKSLEEENARLKKLLAEAMLDKEALQVALGRKF